MNTNRKRVLYFSFLLYFILACRTYAYSSVQDISPTGGNTFTCRQYYDTVIGTGYNCVIDCPSAEDYGFDVPDLLVFQNKSDADIKAQYCPADTSSSQSSSNPLPTEPPTEEPAPPTDAPTDPAPLKPFLTGNFTTCDNLARYVNFTIADDAPAYDPATFKLVFNDQVAKCAPASNNPKVLTCNYPPAPYGPPAYIQVFIGEEQVNDFKFDGGTICDPAEVPQSGDGSNLDPTEAPTDVPPTEAPTDVPPTDESTD